MGSTLDFTPRRVGIVVTAGDTLNLTCDIDGIENLINPVFAGRVKDGVGGHVEDFNVTPTATGAVLSLSAQQVRDLSELNTVGQKVVGGSGVLELWKGFYDLQLSHDGGVRTFMGGSFTIESDVTP